MASRWITHNGSTGWKSVLLLLEDLVASAVVEEPLATLPPPAAVEAFKEQMRSLSPPLFICVGQLELPAMLRWESEVEVQGLGMTRNPWLGRNTDGDAARMARTKEVVMLSIYDASNAVIGYLSCKWKCSTRTRRRSSSECFCLYRLSGV